MNKDGGEGLGMRNLGELTTDDTDEHGLLPATSTGNHHPALRATLSLLIPIRPDRFSPVRTNPDPKNLVVGRF